ncbi:tetratricopeptide repeat protein [Nonomuraea sp. FMUSA5-5]|uniref:Tetratricopeptide repeat protein n=1 Tax=Nonomuraea composti TaxID=2720023 RepID=A0ABX1B5K1_9ACTN|nr:tetratricopeptide repeat protein [Nonomuraea sp. FMUSA5-5]NJP91805.1 tetratricopeptide repeat protein [Nonomuraea sp. FMUSA5-5]
MLPKESAGSLEFRTFADDRSARASLEIRLLGPLEVESDGKAVKILDSAAIPPGSEEAAARYRSLTAASDLLVILDNARDVRQVRPLLPAGRGCRVLITSRDPLTTLNNARHLHLGRLDDTNAATLLARLVGAGRVDAEPRAVEEIVRLCGGFPLALRIAVSHQQLREEAAGQDAAHLLRLLGLLELPVYTPVATAALAGWAEHRRLQEAVACLESGMDCWERAGLPDRKAGMLNELGVVHTQMGRYDDALAALERALAIIRRTGRVDHESYVRNDRAQVYLRQGRGAEAVDEARLAMAMLTQQERRSRSRAPATWTPPTTLSPTPYGPRACSRRRSTSTSRGSHSSRRPAAPWASPCPTGGSATP